MPTSKTILSQCVYVDHYGRLIVSERIVISSRRILTRIVADSIDQKGDISDKTLGIRFVGLEL